MSLESWRLDAPTRTLQWDAISLRLTPIQWRLMCALQAAEGRICSRRELLELVQVGGFRDVCDRTIDIHIRSLRKKMATAKSGVVEIETVYGQGYRLVLSRTATK